MPRRFFRRRFPRRRVAVTMRKGRLSSGQRRVMRRASPRLGLQSVNVHKYVRWEDTDRKIDLPAVALPAAATQFQAHAFTLASLANASEFTALYDQYEITHVQAHVMWAPKNTDGVSFTATTTAFFASGVGNPILYYHTDFDDATNPSSLSEFKQSNKTKMLMLRPGKIIKINLKPAVLHMIYESVGSTAYGPKWRQRIDCADDSVPHYGLKYAIDYLNGTDMGEVTIRYKYWVRFFNVR